MRGVIQNTLILYGMLTVLLPSSSFAQQGPKAQVKRTIENVLDILGDPALKSPEKEEARRNRLKEVIYPRFDFNEMAKRSLGLHWRHRTPQERKEFMNLFADLLEGSYHRKLEAYTDQDIVYTREDVEGLYAVVGTKIASSKENLEIPVEYKLIRRDGEWKVYDVVIEGVSLVSNYRTQFNRIIQTSSYAELVRKMRVKQKAEAVSSASAPKE